MKTKYIPLATLLFAGFVATAQTNPDKVSGQKESKIGATFKVTDLEDYKGQYTSEEDPEGILIFVQDNKLVGKLPQRASIMFEHIGKNQFKSAKDGIVINFSADRKQLIVQSKESTTSLIRK